MKIEQVIEILECQVHFMPEGYDKEVLYASACDLMSDVLTSTTGKKLLLTGLNTPQIIRTASILDLPAVVVVRGKPVQEGTINLAREEGIPLLSTKLTLFLSAARLYNAGLRGVDGLDEF